MEEVGVVLSVVGVGPFGASSWEEVGRGDVGEEGLVALEGRDEEGVGPYWEGAWWEGWGEAKVQGTWSACWQVKGHLKECWSVLQMAPRDGSGYRAWDGELVEAVGRTKVVCGDYHHAHQGGVVDYHHAWGLLGLVLVVHVGETSGRQEVVLVLVDRLWDVEA